MAARLIQLLALLLASGGSPSSAPARLLLPGQRSGALGAVLGSPACLGFQAGWAAAPHLQERGRGDWCALLRVRPAGRAPCPLLLPHCVSPELSGLLQLSELLLPAPSRE